MLSRYRAVCTLTDVERDLCNSIDKVWFAQVWRATRVDIARYNVVFTLTKTAVDSESAMGGGWNKTCTFWKRLCSGMAAGPS